MGSRTLAFRTGSSLPHEPAWSPYPGLSTRRHRNSLAAGSLNLRRRSKPASKYRHETADSPIASRFAPQCNLRHLFPCGLTHNLSSGPRHKRLHCPARVERSEEHTSELQSRLHLVCRLLLEKKKKKRNTLSFQIMY